MTDQSKFFLRWKIDDAAAKFATGRVQSGIFNGGGFQWTIVVERRVSASGNPLNDTADFTVHLAIDPKLGGKRQWKCEAEVIICLTKISGKVFTFRPQNLFTFNQSESTFVFVSELCWNSFVHPVYIIKGRVTMEFLVCNMSSQCEEISDSAKFEAPTNRSNVVLLVGEHRLHVSKELLSIHSPVFEALFFGNFNENGKEEVEIKDVVFEEFLDLLHLIYPGTMTITDRTVLHILKLSNLFQIEHLYKQSLRHLTDTNGIDVVQKLLIADHLSIDELRDYCLNSPLFPSVEEITMKLKSSQEYNNFSPGMKVSIYDRIMALTQEQNK